MRQVLAALVLGMTVASSASAAMAYGDKLDYPGRPGEQVSVTTEAPAQAANTVEVAGPSPTDSIAFPHPADRPGWESGQ